MVKNAKKYLNAVYIPLRLSPENLGLNELLEVPTETNVLLELERVLDGAHVLLRAYPTDWTDVYERISSIHMFVLHSPTHGCNRC